MRVRCVSPHGGGHHGLDADGRPVPEGYDGPRLAWPPNEGGYVENAAVAPHPIAVGSVIDAPDGYEPDGYHFLPADDLPAGGGQGAGAVSQAAPSPAAASPLADLLKNGER